MLMLGTKKNIVHLADCSKNENNGFHIDFISRNYHSIKWAD